MKLCWKDRIIACCIILLFLIFCSIIGKAVIAKVIVKNWGVSNTVTDFIMEGEDTLVEHPKVFIDWKKLYPFDQEEKISIHEKIENKINRSSSPGERLSGWVRKNLWGYWSLIETARRADQYIGWDLYQQEGQYIKSFGNGYLSHIWPRSDMNPKVMAVTEFYQFCQEQNIPFLFVQAPIKISRDLEQQDPKLNGYANRNADDLVQGVKEQGISVLDIRDIIENEEIDSFSLFFKTDHHWKPQAAMWAAGLIAETLHEFPGVNLSYDSYLLKPQEYEEVIYPQIFLGSQGRVWTLGRVEPDDISLFFPKRKTDFICMIPERNINFHGDFSIVYDMSQVQGKDYYHKSAYHAYGYGDEPLIHIENHNQNKNDIKMLIVKDSFGDAMVPFLAMVVKQIDAIDLRHFTGSLQNFIKKHRPDVVLVLYDPSVESSNQINWSSHTDLFDFR